MGAGLSKERQYRIVYRELRKIQLELAKKGITSRYKRGFLYGQKGSDVFCVGYRRSNASNGECALWPIAETNIGGQWASYNDAPWMPEPSWKTAEPLIVEHFAKRFYCKSCPNGVESCAHIQTAADCDDLICEVCGGNDWSPR